MKVDKGEKNAAITAKSTITFFSHDVKTECTGPGGAASSATASALADPSATGSVVVFVGFSGAELLLGSVVVDSLASSTGVS